MIPAVRVDVEYFPLAGGLDLVTPPLSIKPGFCRDAENYEIGVNGGYRRIDGYERFDGRPSPSAAQYVALTVTFSGAVAVGNTVTSGGASGKVIAVTDTQVIVTKTTGTFVAGNDLEVSAVVVAHIVEVGGAPTSRLHYEYLHLAANEYRADIQVVPGSGPVRGFVVFKGERYAFRDNAGGTACVMHKASASGWSAVTTPVLAPGGSYRFAINNFGAGDRLFGCDGANKAFMFDGTAYTEITTGMSPDKPEHVIAHKNYLFLAFGNSVQHSAIGDPTNWTPVLGAGELNIGQQVTNLVAQPGSENSAALAIYGRNSTFILYGTGTSDWNLVTVQSDAGGLPGTAQYLGQTFVLDDRGVTTLQTSSNYGNFVSASVSNMVRPWLTQRKGTVTTSGISREKNQYRLFFSGGAALYMTLGGGFMPVYLGKNFTCYWSGEDSDGSEVAFAGTSDGYVMQFDKGTSFDGAEIASWVELAFNHIKSPRTKKLYRKCVLEIGGGGYGSMYVSAQIGYASPEYAHVPISEQVAQLSAGQWDSGVWDAGVWDGRILAPSEFHLGGTAENIAIRIAQISAYQIPLTFHGAIIHYTPRRILR